MPGKLFLKRCVITTLSALNDVMHISLGTSKCLSCYQCPFHSTAVSLVLATVYSPYLGLGQSVSEVVYLLFVELVLFHVIRLDSCCLHSLIHKLRGQLRHLSGGLESE